MIQSKTTLPPAIVPGRYQFLPGLPIEVFAALKADVAKRGVLTPIDVDEDGDILDGHHRWRAHCETGRNEAPPVIVRSGLSEAEKMAFARRQNILRRHLSREDVRRVVKDQLRDTPNRSDRSIAADLGVDHKTVGVVRRDAGGEFPHLTERQGRDGKNYRMPEQALRRGRSAMPNTSEDFVKAMLGSAGATRANAERVAALPETVKLAMFHAWLSARATTVFRGNPYGHPPLESHEEKAWDRYDEYLQARLGVPPEDVSDHLNWVVGHKGFRSPDEWLGEEGRRFRAREGTPEPSADFLAGWKRHSGESVPVQPPKELER
jgi:ParB-like chromosome segregation protein Spo0J